MMSKTQQLISTVTFETTERPAVIPQILGHAAVLNNVSLKDYVTNGKILAECQLKALKHYQHDALFAFFDLALETEALGSKLFYPDNDYPNIQQHAIKDLRAIPQWSLSRLSQKGRIPQLLEGIRLMKAEVGNEIPIIGIFSGPMTILTQLMSMEKALFLAVDELDTFLSLLDFTASFAIELAKLMIDAGVNVTVLFDPAVSPEIIPSGFFREFIQPKIRKILIETKKAGCLYNWLNITGNIMPIFPYVKMPEVDILNIDYPVDPIETALYFDNICIDGNIKPLSFQEESEKFIYEECKELLRIFRHRKGFILSSGCEIPFNAKPENIKAMVEAAGSWDR